MRRRLAGRAKTSSSFKIHANIKSHVANQNSHKNATAQHGRRKNTTIDSITSDHTMVYCEPLRRALAGRAKTRKRFKFNANISNRVANPNSHENTAVCIGSRIVFDWQTDTRPYYGSIERKSPTLRLGDGFPTRLYNRDPRISDLGIFSPARLRQKFSDLGIFFLKNASKKKNIALTHVLK